MANSGKVSIDSSTINQIITILKESSDIVKNDISGKLPGVFEVIAPLYSNGLTKIKEQANGLYMNEDKMITELSSHISTTQETEDELKNALKNKQTPYSVTYGGGGGGGSHNLQEVTDDDTEKGKEINTKLKNKIEKLDEKSIVELINLIDQKKDSLKLSLNDLLFNYKNSKELYKTLAEFFGIKVDDLSFLVEEDQELVQKMIIEKLISIENPPVTIVTNTVLSAKEFLDEVAKKNNTTVPELFTKEENQTLLQQSLTDLYNGTNLDGFTITSSTVTNFRTFVDSLASDKNMTPADVLNDVSILL